MGSRIFGARRWLWLATAGLSLSAAPATHAQSVDAAAVDVPSQPLSTTLNQIGRQTGSEVIFASTDVGGKFAPAVRGRYTAAQALQIALRGTSLSIRRTPQGAYLIEPAASSARVAPADFDASTSDNGGDIIVTARRVEERLQDVPIAITAYTQQTLEERNVSNANDIAAFTPSLTANPRFGVENTTFSIRGFIQDPFTQPTVAVYFAEAVALRGGSSVQSGEGAGPGSFFDLQNVQVLKGPQGTLFGRNTTGGAILIVPKRPTSEFGGYLLGSYGNYDMTRLQGVLNIPVGEGGIRLGFDRMKRDGFLRNIGIGPSKMADIDYVAFRASFLQPLTDNLENYAIFTYARSDTTGTTPKPISCSPAVTIGSNTATGGQIPAGRLACDSLARVNAARGFYTLENPIDNPRSYLNQFQAINTTTWAIGDNLTLKNIVTYGELINRVNNDPSGTYWKIRADDPNAGLNGRFGNFTDSVIFLSEARFLPGRDTNAQSTFTEELQLQGSAFDSNLSWQAGGYYELSKSINPFVGNRGRGFTVCSNLLNFVCRAPYGVTGSVNQELRNTSYRNTGVFAQATYKLLENLRLTGGLRYSWDSSKSVDQQITYRFLPNAPAGAVPIKSCTNTNAVLPDCILQTPLGGGYYTTRAPTWLISLDYKPSEDILVYAKYSRGYRQGSVNPRALIPFKQFGPEKLDTYEAGIKASWQGAMPGLLDLAIFYNDFKSQQFLLSYADANGRTSSATSNSAKSRGYGLELSGGVEPLDGLRVTGAFAYLNTKLLEVNYPPSGPPGFPVVINADNTGDPFPLVSKYKAAATVKYIVPIDPALGEVSIAGTWQYNSGFHATGLPLSVVAGHSEFGFNADWRNAGEQPIDIGFFAKNITGKHYYTFVNDNSSRGFVSAQIGEPRTFGVQMKVRFGSDAD